MKRRRLKRHRGLVPFAREHGFILICVQKLRNSMRETRDARIALVNLLKSGWFLRLATALENEQIHFAPVLARTGLAHRFQYMHGKLRDIMHAFRKLEKEEDPGIGRMSMASNALEDYVRWEENYLFPTLESLLSNEELEELGNALEDTRLEKRRVLEKVSRVFAVKKLEKSKDQKLQNALVVR